MKDLLVYVADADALGFIRSILQKPAALAIRPISFDIERHPQRDSGMIQSGAELARMKKGRYEKALLVWDHHGSGRDHKQSPQEIGKEMQGKLDSFTWSGNSTVAVLVPELEQWLWFCENAVAANGGVSAENLGQWVQEHAEKLGSTVADLKACRPKELFEHIMRDRLKRTVSPRDFEEIGKRASIHALMECSSFCSIVEALRIWFPP
jgi:hypothetical protein